jgi:hypothetical protein
MSCSDHQVENSGHPDRKRCTPGRKMWGRRTRGRARAEPGHYASLLGPAPSQAALGARVAGRGPWSRPRSRMSGHHPTRGTDELIVKGERLRLRPALYPDHADPHHDRRMDPTDAGARPVGVVRRVCGVCGRTRSRRWCWRMRPWRGRAWMRLLPPPSAERERSRNSMSHQELQKAPPSPPVYGGHSSRGRHGRR